MDYPWYTKLILGTAVVLLLSSPSASGWRFLGEWSSHVALIAIGLILMVLVDYTAAILGELRDLSQREQSR
jgi:hypothetical protein